ncbi:zinc ribbon domain-containing protein [Thermomicrobium sp. 4228-Ro]|uniref:FmdB family zinc ribbon protein n=1 Tax=Thermomicrobium sp. 4228-Ro TaxID=2993937 RepID=UPI002248B103|nr:zinc ribbon domain-containing protein [Thermomicrobium sp. 4228-Ro]MCX2727851.1 zinc ribbon domain-containing protein [Thermomicrobium sp. 4228-Ro]
MPIYEYRCQRCGYRFEKLVRLSQAAQPVVCPNCGTDETERLLSAFAARSTGDTGTATSCSTGGG